MANPREKVAENVIGDFFVDQTCIDCDTCRQLAPGIFGQGPEHSFVSCQPESPAEKRSALHALVCCPTGSIGSEGSDDPKSVLGEFPLPIEGAVYYCGFNSPKSFGGNSYFIRHPKGNWLIDAPKYLPQLVRRIEGWGGLSHVFLTHRDDVADAARYAERFDADRIIHREELASQPDAEVVLEGNEPVELAPGFLVIPTPGHTAGHCVLLFQNRFLFTGDHLQWSRDAQRLDAHRDYCWHSWPQQVESLRRLANYRFEWILPGHGQRIHLPADEMQRQMQQLLARL